MQAERLRAAGAADESLRAAREDKDRAVAAAASDATAEAWRKARAEADAELVKLRRAVDTTSLWYEDQLDAARAERDRCTGKSLSVSNNSCDLVRLGKQMYLHTYIIFCDLCLYGANLAF